MYRGQSLTPKRPEAAAERVRARAVDVHVVVVDGAVDGAVDDGLTKVWLALPQTSWASFVSKQHDQ